MIRVLQCVNNMHRAGLETLLMNYYRNIDRTKIQFDFLVHRPERSDYDDEIESLGGRIFRAPRLYPQNYPAYFAFMAQFFREHPEYKIVHSHIDAMSYLPLLAAKKAGVPIRISHSHSTALDLDVKYPLKKFFRSQLKHVATHCFACGEEAGKFLFGGREFRIIPNAIDAQKFLFQEAVRTEKRQELGIRDKTVIGHAGRFTYAKNHIFLLKVFGEILQREPDAVLLLAGTGEKEEKIRTYADKLKISDHVMFLGSRPDLHELYQAMDVFVLPSLFEGVPVVGIEAQYAGLPCIFSDRVPREVMFTEQCQFLALEKNADQWAQQIMRSAKESNRTQSVACATFDIQKAHRLLENYYLELYKA